MINYNHFINVYQVGDIGGIFKVDEARSLSVHTHSIKDNKIKKILFSPQIWGFYFLMRCAEDSVLVFILLSPCSLAFGRDDKVELFNVHGVLLVLNVGTKDCGIIQ